MQPGAGVASLRPAVTLGGLGPDVHWGIRAAAMLPLGINPRGWAPGRRIDLDVWTTLSLAPELAVSLHGAAREWGDVRGRDPDPSLAPGVMPNGRPELQGGRRTDLGLGLQWRADARSGLRLSAEYLRPVHQELHGPQLARDWTLGFGLEVRLPH